MSMRIQTGWAWALVTCAGLCGAPALEPAFHLRLENVKFAYPGAEYWAVIQGPGSNLLTAFAIYEGQQRWRVPLRNWQAGDYRILKVERRAGGETNEVRLGEGSELRLKVEAAAERPGFTPPAAAVVKAGDFQPFFAAQEPWCVNDHTFIQGPDRTWHLFGITHPKPLDFFKDPGRSLCHATAETLLQKPWHAQPPAVTRDWEKFHEYLLWAPYVMFHNGLYYMFVCAGEKDAHRYRLHLLTSPDLKTWARSPENPIVIDGFDARDPFVMRVGKQWALYYTATSTPEGGNHIVACVTSDDLVHWSNRRAAFIHPRAGSFGGPTESPFVVQRGRRFYLFVCDNDWTDVYVSEDPFQWRFDQKNTRIRSHASEIVRDANGKWFISHAGWMSGPLSLAPLLWQDGLDAAETNIQPGAK